ncbi:MAG TPA: thioredoxin family protein [Armatimonadota bacterium]|nr:thioredoxin family protein [Armatimonadota bacterium]HQK93790.1 thioredoxin family protein [Armatimonadota bacterium]
MRTCLLGTACVVLLSISASVVTAQEPEWIREDEAAALARAKAEDKLVLVDIWANWCGWCKKLDQDVFTKPEFAEAAKDFVLLKVDSDANEGYLEKTGQEGLPTTAFLLPDGRLLCARSGYMPVEAYVAMLDEAKSLRGKLDADVGAMTLDDALATAQLWLQWGNGGQAGRIFEALEARQGLTDEQLRSVDLSQALGAIGSNDMEKATALLGRRIAPGLRVTEFDPSDSATLKRALRGVAMLWLDVITGGQIVSFSMQDQTGLCIVPGEMEGQKAFLAAVTTLQALPDPAGCTAEEAARIGHLLCQFSLTDLAMPYLERGGPASAADLVAAQVAAGKPATALETANAALEGEVTGQAKGLLLAAKTLALAAATRTDEAKATRDELLALEGLDPDVLELWTSFFDDETMAQL